MLVAGFEVGFEPAYDGAGPFRSSCAACACTPSLTSIGYSSTFFSSSSMISLVRLSLFEPTFTSGSSPWSVAGTAAAAD